MAALSRMKRSRGRDACVTEGGRKDATSVLGPPLHTSLRDDRAERERVREISCDGEDTLWPGINVSSRTLR